MISRLFLHLKCLLVVVCLAWAVKARVIVYVISFQRKCRSKEDDPPHEKDLACSNPLMRFYSVKLRILLNTNRSTNEQLAFDSLVRSYSLQ